MTSTDRIDGLTAEVAIKAPVRVATTANITLSGTQTIDGVAVVADDRVLVKDQTTATENGIYIASATAWSRAKDFDGNRDVVQGTLVAVKKGTTNGNTVWRVSTADDITIDTSSIAFEIADVFAGEGAANRYNFDSTTTMADPGSGDLRFDSATLSSVTAIAVSDNPAESGSPDLSALFATWDDSTTSSKGTITIRKIGTPSTFATFTLTALTDQTGWFQFTVTYVASNGTFSDADRIIIQFTRAGDAGADGSDGIFSAIASQAEAEAGADNTKGMSPLRTAQAIDAINRTLTASPSADTTASGTIVSLTAGENLAFGEICYIKSDGKLWKTDADAAASMPAVAMALATINADASGSFLLSGFVRNDAWNWTVGGAIYASVTAGALSQSAVSGTDDCHQVIGFATHADRMIFNPSPDYITVTA